MKEFNLLGMLVDVLSFHQHNSIWKLQIFKTANFQKVLAF